MKFSFRNKKKSSQEKSAAIQNPYINGSNGRKEWNDRYMNMAKAKYNWQLAFISVMMLALGMLLLIVKLSTQSQIKPVVVETCSGMPTNILPVSGNIPNEDRLVNYIVTQFIINARTIVADTEAQKIFLDKVYAYSADNTMPFMRDYYHENNPFVLSSKYTTQISIINTILISPHTWQITWDETQMGSTSGDDKKRWVATLTYRLGKVNPRFIKDNPFGIYITAISWSPISIK